jgi:hypothetical protein
VVGVIRIILIIININIAIELVKATVGILGPHFPWLQKIVPVRIGLKHFLCTGEKSPKGDTLV